MATQVKHRRGSTSELASFTPAVGEIVVDTEKYSLRVGDGIKQGGHVIQSTTVKQPVVYKNNQFELIAHRGFRKANPQNTMMAFSSALRLGADSFECDFQVTSDGVVVVYHDDTLDTLTDGTGTISVNTLNSVQTAIINQVAGTIYEDHCKIPLASSILEYAKSTRTPCYVEIKNYRTQADISLMMNAIVAADMVDLTNISSFNFSDVEAARAYNEDIEVGFLLNTTDILTMLSAIDDLALLGGKVALITSVDRILENPTIVTAAATAGVLLAAYTVNDVYKAKQLINLGVTKIMSDSPLETL